MSRLSACPCSGLAKLSLNTKSPQQKKGNAEKFTCLPIGVTFFQSKKLLFRCYQRKNNFKKALPWTSEACKGLVRLGRDDRCCSSHPWSRSIPQSLCPGCRRVLQGNTLGAAAPTFPVTNPGGLSVQFVSHMLVRCVQQLSALFSSLLFSFLSSFYSLFFLWAGLGCRKQGLKRRAQNLGAGNTGRRK